MSDPVVFEVTLKMLLTLLSSVGTIVAAMVNAMWRLLKDEIARNRQQCREENKQLLEMVERTLSQRATMEKTDEQRRNSQRD